MSGPLRKTASVLLLALAGASSAAPPRVVDDRYQLELVASEPEIVTPIGLAFDRQGRLLVVESHTHDRPEDYDGPAADRILMLADSNGDGRLDRWSTFAEGIRDAMNLLVRPDGAVYVVTGKKLLLLRDTAGDGVADQEETLLRLETDAPNPHNSLNGIARQSDGSLLIGLGQTRTFPYRLIDAQGNELSGTDGAGGIFHISASGGGLTRVATGLWNPFSICTLPDGRIFAVDNDPDDRPPCRLLHVVWGGDYGYRYQYTRGGTHPLQAWDGELPGTLPMVCGTGEAPTAIVPHAGSLWVTSWGDHRIERYRLVPRGASYDAEREIVVQGNHDFRPSGMAVAPDGSLYFGDWVLRDYPVHGRGRIWRLVLLDDELQTPFPPPSEPEARLSVTRLGELEELRLRGTERAESILREALRDESADVRLFAVRWIADERITALREDVARLLDEPPPSRRYYLAVLAAVDWLDHEPDLRSRDISDELLVRELRNERRSPEIQALALGLLSPDDEYLTLDRLRGLLQAQHQPLRLEAARALAQQSNPRRFELLAAMARDDAQREEVRAEAVAGLSAAAEQFQDVLEELAADKSQTLRHEAKRALRLAGLRPAPVETKPAADDLTAWQSLLDRAGDAAAGRRLFFSPVGARCSVCHQHSGRGGDVGPDLTHIGQGTSRERIVASILQPSQEIAPDYQPWLLVTKDGETHLGLRPPRPVGRGIEHYIDSAGEQFSLRSEEIEFRQASTVSIMPDGLERTLSVSDLRDLVAFLTTPAD